MNLTDKLYAVLRLSCDVINFLKADADTRYAMLHPLVGHGWTEQEVLQAAKMQEFPDDWFYLNLHFATNHLNADASMTGTMYETYGEEFAFVQAIDKGLITAIGNSPAVPRYVYTIADGDETTVVLPGLRHVNRIGYLISATKLPDGLSFIDDDALSRDGSDE